MATIDGAMFTYGDLIMIGGDARGFLYVEDPECVGDVQLGPVDPVHGDKRHVVLVAGNKSLAPGHFYLTFKYARGFLFLQDGKLKNGAPWPERTVFDAASLKKAMGIEKIEIKHLDIPDE